MKAEFKAVIDRAPMRVVQIGSKLHVFVGVDTTNMTERFQKVIDRALRNGQTVTENGIAQWESVHPIRDNSQVGSACYTWHADGNRVRCERFRFIRCADGSVVKQALGFCWAQFTSV